MNSTMKRIMHHTRNSKLGLATALLTLCSLTAFAQAPEDAPPPGPPPSQGQPGNMHRGGPGPERQLNMLTRVLTLTPDQQKGVKTILEQQATEMKALRDKSPADPSSGQTAETREARMTQMNQIRSENDTKIAALLDENQKKTFADWQQRRKTEMERRDNREGRGPGGPDGPGGDQPPPLPPNQ